MVQSCTKRDRRSSRNATSAAVFCASIVCMAGAASAQQPAPDTRAGRIAAQQQEKSKQLKHYEPNKAEVWVKKLEQQFITGSLRWHPFFQSAYAGGGFTLGAGYAAHVSSVQHDRRSRQLHVQRLQTDGESSSRRRGCSTAAGPCGARRLARGDAGRLLRDWHRQHLADDRTNYSFQQPYGSAMLERASGAELVHARRRRRILPVGPAPGRGHDGRRSKRSTRPPRCRAWAPRSPTCTCRAQPPSTGAPAAGYSRRGGSTAPRSTTTRTPTTSTASSRWTTTSSSTAALTRRLGAVAARPGRDHLRERRRGDSVLHAAGPGRRLGPARVLELALPRPPQPAAAGRVARARQLVLRHCRLLRRRQGRGQPDRIWTSTA